MARKAKTLSPLAISKLTKDGLHFTGHVSGLGIRISKLGAKSWILRYSIAGKRRDMGLGSYSEISLKDAKDIALSKRQLIREGIDPIDNRQTILSDLITERASSISFLEASKNYIQSHKKSWKNAKHAKQWSSTLNTYVYPIIGDLNVKDIELNHMLRVLEPVWEHKTETAKRIRGRMEMILDWSTVRGYREGNNPARWKGNLNTILPAPSKVSKVRHHRALDWKLIRPFMQELKSKKGNSARALEFIILTAGRSGEVRGAKWSEVDLNHQQWTIPSERMKSAKEHRVALSKQAIELLLTQKSSNPSSDLLFPSPTGKALSDMSISMLLRKMGKDFTVHGFRSTFRDWAGECSVFPRDVIEQALAHKLKDKVEASYARGDMFHKRKELMESWSAFTQTAYQKNNVSYLKKAS